MYYFVQAIYKNTRKEVWVVFEVSAKKALARAKSIMPKKGIEQVKLLTKEER